MCSSGYSLQARFGAKSDFCGAGLALHFMELKRSQP
jgi:hypothetical protein